MNIANFVLQEPTAGTDIERWFRSIVQKTNYCFFKFNGKIYGVFADRGRYAELDFPYELERHLKK